MSAALELFFDVRISYDRTCDKLREESDVAGKVYGIFLSCCASVNVHLIA